MPTATDTQGVSESEPGDFQELISAIHELAAAVSAEFQAIADWLTDLRCENDGPPPGVTHVALHAREGKNN